MRRVETFVGAAGLLELLDSPKQSPQLPAAKRQRNSKEHSKAELEALASQVDLSPSLLHEMIGNDDDFSLSPLLLPQAAITPPPLDLGGDVHPSNLLTPSTADVMADEPDMIVPLALYKHDCALAGPPLDRKSKSVKQSGRSTAAKDHRTSKSGEQINRLSAAEADHKSWQSKLHDALSNGSDALTRALLSGALTADGPGTIAVLARLSPRQVDALKPDAVATLVRDQVELTRRKMMRNVLGVSGFASARPGVPVRLPSPTSGW